MKGEIWFDLQYFSRTIDHSIVQVSGLDDDIYDIIRVWSSYTY